MKIYGAGFHQSLDALGQAIHLRDNILRDCLVNMTTDEFVPPILRLTTVGVAFLQAVDNL